MKPTSNFCLSKYYEALIAVGLATLSISYQLVEPLRSELAYAPWVDDVWGTGPLLCEASRQWAHGHLPAFNWTSFETFHHNAHFTPVYPLYLFGIYDFCSVGAAVQGQDIIKSIHLLILFINALILGRVLSLSWLASAFLATLVATSLNFRALAAWPTVIASASWLPLAFSGLVLIFERRRYSLGFAILTSSVTLLLYAGPGSNAIAPLAILGLMLVGWYIARSLMLGEVRSVMGPLLTLALAAIAILLLNIGSTINLLLHMQEMVRWTRSGPVVGITSPPIGELLTEQKSPGAALSILLPINLKTIGSFFVGSFAIALATVGIAANYYRTIVQVCTAVVLATMTAMFFDPNHLVVVMSYAPGLHHIRHLSLIASCFVIAIGLLAAFGLDAITEQQTPKLRLILRGMVIMLGGVTLAFLASDQDHYSWRPSITISVFIGFLSLSLLSFGLPRRFILAAALLLLPLQTVTRFWDSNLDFAPAIDAQLRSPTWRSLEEALNHIKTSDPYPGRIAFDGTFQGDELNYVSAPSVAHYMGLPTFQSYLQPRAYWLFAKEFYRYPDYEFYGLRGGKYVLSTSELTSIQLERFFQIGTVRVYKIKNARGWVGSLCGDLASLPSMFARDAAPGRLPGISETVETDIEQRWRAQSPDCDRGQVSKVRMRPEKDDVTWITGGESWRFLIINLPPYRGWRLTISEKSVPLFNLDDTQIVAAVPPELAGRSTLTYSPTFYYARLAASSVALGLLILVWLSWSRLVARFRFRSEPTECPNRGL